jgi:hypothetical protein
MSALTAVMSLYAWGVAAAIVFFLYLIARFFEEKAGQRSYYGLFLVPIVALVLGAFEYALYSKDFVGDFLGDALLFVGGVLLMIAGGNLLRLMVGGRK